MNSCEFTSFVTAIACTIAKCTPEEDLPIITALFSQLASTLATIAVHEESCEKKRKLEEEKARRGTRTIENGQNKSSNNETLSEEPLLGEVPDIGLITIPPITTPPSIIR